MDVASVRIRKIRNGYIVQYREGVEVDDSAMRNVLVRLGGTPSETAKNYRFDSVEVYAKDAEEIAKILPQALQALILQDAAPSVNDEYVTSQGLTGPASIGLPYSPSSTSTGIGIYAVPNIDPANPPVNPL
jgi:hypothetical protein